MPKLRSIIAASFLLSLATFSQADVLSITDPAYQVPNSAEGVVRPANMMSMSEVEQQFGKPVEVVSAVGEPPISRWIYKEFIVYFEYDRVIQSVVIRD